MSGMPERQAAVTRTPEPPDRKPSTLDLNIGRQIRRRRRAMGLPNHQVADLIRNHLPAAAQVRERHQPR